MASQNLGLLKLAPPLSKHLKRFKVPEPRAKPSVSKPAHRSSVPAELAATIATMRELAESLGGQIEISDAYSAWPFKADSLFRDMLVELFKSVYNVEAVIGATHGGLECGAFAEKMPEADIISIGPTVLDAHSPNERMSLSLFNRACDFVIAIL